MKPLGKKVTLFLVDDEPNGRVSAELSNWIGKAYKTPRTLVKDSRTRDELSYTGVYLLFGKNPDNPSEEMVYIGEAESIYNRLVQHLNEREFWFECISLYNKGGNLNKAQGKYLEGRLYEEAASYGRFKIENAIVPAKAALSESDIAEMEAFLADAKLVVYCLGYRLFEPAPDNSQDKTKSELFYIKAARNADAIGYLSDEGFVVKKASAATLETTPSLKTSNAGYFKLRQKLIEDGILALQNDRYVFTRDYTFSAPSAAAATVMGRAANGRTEWKTANGVTLEEYEG